MTNVAYTSCTTIGPHNYTAAVLARTKTLRQPLFEGSPRPAMIRNNPPPFDRVREGDADSERRGPRGEKKQDTAELGKS